MKTIWNSAALLTLACLTPAAQAELSTLNVSFNPDSESFYQGEIINISLTADGSNMQYRYVLEEVTEDGIEKIKHSRWTNNNQFTLDSQAMNLPEGNYRLRVISREQGNKDEVLVKYHTFDVTGSNTSACSNFQEGAYDNSSAVALSMSLTLNEALGVLNSEGLLLSSSEHAANIEQPVFDDGNVLVYPASPVTYSLSFYGDGQLLFPDPLTGSYSCTGSTLTINASGSGNPTGYLGTIISGIAVSFSGDASINGNTGAIETVNASFQ